MDTHVVNHGNEVQWRLPIYEFARDLDLLWRCNVLAVAEERWENTYPSMEIIDYFIDHDDCLVLALEENDQVKGYILSSPDGYIKWAGILPQHVDQWMLLIGGVVSVYGQAWGRVQNEQMRQSLLDNVEELGQTEGGDPEVIGTDL